jgi:DNA-nicking Smr family endonuclease
LIEKKGELHQLAYAPVKRLQQEYDSLREELNSTTIHSNSNWLAKKKQMTKLKKQLMAAKENAHNDIYERMNSVSSIGISFSGQITSVDLHGLSVEGAKQIVYNTILPVLPVLKKIMIITGRGLHSADEQGVLKPAVKNYLEELEIKCEDVERNEGAIYALA